MDFLLSQRSAYQHKIVSMQPKFTLKKSGVSYFLTSAFCFLFLIFAGTINAQQYINGNLTTGATSSNGSTAPAGFTWSEVQAGNGSAGFTGNISGFTLADNFTISCGNWGITKMTFFAYSTGYAGATSPFNDVRVQIFNTDPSVGSPVPVFGNLTTNRFLASSTASMYRIFTATPGTTRQLWKIEATVNVTLGPGTYWVEWGVNNTTPLGSNFTPASTVIGTTTQPGANGKQHATGGAWTNVLDGTNPQDFHFIVDYTDAACTGTPVPGNSLSTATTVCPGTNFTLSLQNCVAGTGVTYQWQVSTDGGTTWANIAGATSATLNRTHSAASSYRCNVTCSGNTATSNPVAVALTPPSGCYCVPGASDCTDDDVITRVRISTLDNSSTCSTGPPAGYSNYTSSVAAPTIYSGAANPITVNVPTVWTEQVAVWIDYNQSGTFEASEYTNVGSNVGNGGVITANIAVPAGLPSITTRMRVRVRFSTAWTSGLACSAVTFGETEDYNVNIVPCVPATITTQPAPAVTTTCGGNASFTVAAAGTLPVYGWEWRPNSTTNSWQMVTNGGVYSGATTSTLTLTNVSAAYSGYQYRALVTGGCSAVDFSNISTLTVNPIQATVSPASASICLGAVQQLSLTNLVSAPTTTTFTATTGLPLSIPDATPNGVWNSVNVSGIPAGSVITDVSVRLNITHTYVGDLEINLLAPNGANLSLIAELDGGTGSNSTDNFTNTVISSTGTVALSGFAAPRTGTFRADRLQFYGPSVGPGGTGTGYQTVAGMNWPTLLTTINGTWNLGLSDWYAGDAGTLTSWSLAVTYVAPNFAQGTWAGPAGTIFTDAAATTAYTGTPATSVYVLPTATGVNNYTVSFNTPTPCTSATATVPVTVSAPITAVSVAPATRAVCLGGSTTFNASVTGGTNTTYQWQRSTDAGLTWSNISGATAATLTVSSVTSNMTGYRYRVVASSGACASLTSTTFGTITVNALPTVTIATPVVNVIPGTTTTLTGSSTPAAAATNSWTWTLNGNNIAGNTNTQTATVDLLGTYQATVTDVNGCVNKSNQLVIGAEASDKLWIYPNPTPGAFQVRLYYAGNTAEKRVVSVYNAKGQLITSRTFDLNYRSTPYLSMNFDLSGMARGTYVVKVAHEYSGKVISGLVLVH
jgi:subtilisin-like proprotein convertase family protein